MITPKTFADILTASRFVMAWVLFWLGINSGASALPAAAVILVIAWLTDLLDGPFARKDPSGRRTWIGDHDLETDISVSIGVLTYLVLSGYLAAWVAVSYVIICIFLLWRFRSLELAWVVQAPPFAVMLFIALLDAPIYGFLMVAYLVAVIFATWPRFIQVTLPQFFSGMKNLSKTDISQEETSENVIVENGNKSSQV